MRIECENSGKDLRNREKRFILKYVFRVSSEKRK